MINTLQVIVGPTSTGKTNYALSMCQKSNGVIVSADSRQMYKYMDIGTGKVPVDIGINVKKGNNYWTLDGIDIWGYDLTTPDMYFSAFDYAEFAINKLNELIENFEYDSLMLVGGTGLYVDIVTGRKQLEGVEPDFELRKELESESLENLQAKLTSLNKKAYKNIDIKNKSRLVRAIEKELNKNKPKKTLPQLKINNYEFTGFTMPRPLLYQKADNWLKSVWQNGLVEETEFLMQNFPDSQKLNGLIYKNVKDYVQGNDEKESAMQRAMYDLHAYIRRQQTWFKKNPEIKWVDVSDTTNIPTA